MKRNSKPYVYEMNKEKTTDVFKAAKHARKQISNIVNLTPLTKNVNLSNHYSAEISFKREDLQVMKSFKIRGIFNKISTLASNEKTLGIITLGIQHHAFGVAYCSNLLKVSSKIYMPKNTAEEIIKKIKLIGKEHVRIILAGDTIDETASIALGDASIHNKIFVHPFDDLKVIAGHATVGLEIYQQSNDPID